jgi:hypothetical protein
MPARRPGTTAAKRWSIGVAAMCITCLAAGCTATATNVVSAQNLRPRVAPATKPTVKPTAKPTATPTPTRSATASPTPASTLSPSGTATPTIAPPSSSSPPVTPPVNLAGTSTRPFSITSVWNTPIPAGSALDPNTAAMESTVLRNPGLVLNVDLYSFGLPFYTATPSTPRVRIKGMASGTSLVPFDSSWSPNAGADSKVTIFDPATSKVFELWDFHPATMTTGWGVEHNYATENGDGYAPPDQYHQSPTGAGFSQAAGVIRIADIRKGSIDHALTFVTSNPTAAFRYPASKSDGSFTGLGGLPEGARIQLDPSVNVDAIPGMSAGERMIAKALQTYGAICVDTGGGNNQAMGFYAEKPTAGMTDPYPLVGFTSDWAQLSRIPRDKLHVLNASVTRKP